MFKNTNKKYKALGINIYGGGFTLGVSRHFEILGQLEEITLGKKTFEMNFPDLYRPIVPAKDWPVKKYKDNVDFVYANPPCAPWSSANTHKGKTKASRFVDKRLALTQHTYETAVKIRPDIFISESVEAGYNIGASHYDQYIDMWMKAGYAVTFYMNDAIIQGAPCMRRRFHFIAHKYKLDLTPPKIIAPKTVEESIGDLIELNGQVPLHELRPMCKEKMKIVKRTKPGQPLRKTMLAMKNYNGPKIGFFQKRLRWDRPAFTIVGFDYIHPLEDRWITFREAMRLCTYPDWFMAHSAVEAVDAVLPSVAEHLAKIAKKSITRKEPCPVEYNFVDWRPLAKDCHINSKNYPEEI